MTTLTILNSKICPMCEQNKELSEYYTKIRNDGSIYYWRECKKCVTIRSHNWEIENPEAYAISRNKKESQPDRIEYRKEDWKRQRDSGYTLGWQRANPDKLKVYGQLHEDHIISKKEWIDEKEYFNNECAYCGLKIEDHYFTRLGITKNGDFHKDHLVHNGSNYIDNCIPACKSCNCSKHTATLDEWYRKQDFFTESRYNKIIQWSTEDYNKYLKPRKGLI